MVPERPSPDDHEAFPAGENAPAADEPPTGDETYPAGVESDEGERPDDQLEDGQPGLLDEPPRAD